MKFPTEIDPKTYKPSIGDKIEITYPDGTMLGDTVLVGVVAYVEADLSAYTKGGTLLFYGPDDTRYSYRLLSRDTHTLKVGMEIDGATEAGFLPVGTILETEWHHRGPYQVVILSSERGRYRYHRVDANYAWLNITGVWRIMYLPEKKA